jgi:hypothetical protein
MKYLRLFESSSLQDIKQDIEDILLEINDMGYNSEVIIVTEFSLTSRRGKSVLKNGAFTSGIEQPSRVKIVIDSKDTTRVRAFGEKELEDISDVIMRIYDYMSDYKPIVHIYLKGIGYVPISHSAFIHKHQFNWVDEFSAFSEIRIIYNI